MSYEIYLDVYLVENFVMNYILLRMTNRLLSGSATQGRSLLAAGAGAVLAVLGLVGMYSRGRTALLLLSAAANTLMVRFGCKIKGGGHLIQGTLLFYMGTACMGAAMGLLRCRTGGEGVTAFLAAAFCCYWLLTGCFWLYGRLSRGRKREWNAVLIQKENCIRVKALYDTGNMLWDTTLQSHVSVVEISLVKKLVSEEAGRELELFCEKQASQNPGALAELKPHYISYRTVGCSPGLLPAVVLQELLLEQGTVHRRITHPVVAIDRTHSSSLRNYQMILNPNLIDS